jgi:hypothetical protein
MFLIAMFIIYSNYMSSIVTLLLLSSCICLYSVYPKVPRVDDLHYVGMVLRYIAYLRVLPDVPGHVVDHEGDYLSTKYGRQSTEGGARGGRLSVGCV